MAKSKVNFTILIDMLIYLKTKLDVLVALFYRDIKKYNTKLYDINQIKINPYHIQIPFPK